LSEQSIEYLGYGNPQTKEEIEFEIISLNHAISSINLKICDLKRKMYLADLATSKGLANISQLFGDDHENVQDKFRETENHRKENIHGCGYKEKVENKSDS